MYKFRWLGVSGSQFNFNPRNKNENFNNFRATFFLPRELLRWKWQQRSKLDFNGAGTAFRGQLFAHRFSIKLQFLRKLCRNFVILFNCINHYQRGKRGSRRFSGTFSIIERENGKFDALINAEVELLNGNRNNGNRNRYPNNNYSPNSNYNPNNFGNAGPGMPGAFGYAGQYNY